MRKILIYMSLIFPLTILLTGIFWYTLSPQFRKSVSPLAPIPDFINLTKNDQVRLLDFWSPTVEKTHGSEGAIEGITAQSIMMYDLTTDKPLYEREVDVRRPMASLTKIMTAVITLENKRSDNRYVVRDNDIVGEDSMGVEAGEVLTQEELLYGLMLPSGNDAAEVLANNYPKGRVEFIKAMNDKARALGLKDTQFSNPSGLQGDGTQYTTAHDLLILTRYALEHYPLFAQIVATPTYDIPQTDTHKAYTLANETNLLTTYQGVKGVKTGFTPEAGLCLVTYIEYGDHKIIGVILNSQNRRGEMKELLDYSLKSVGVTPPPFEDPI
jgi:D-alanyl-D-alanine carboxypeptidase (penicillin-binding protein 5/6)